MNLDAFAAEFERNRAAYLALRSTIRDADRGYAAIAHGRLVALADTFDEAMEAIRGLEPPPTHFLVFPVDEEPAFELIDDFAQQH